MRDADSATMTAVSHAHPPKPPITRRPVFALALLAVALAWPATMRAEVFRGLFTGAVPVWSRDGSERKEATVRALLQVLTRVSGRSSLSENAALLEGLASAQRLVRSYRYVATRTAAGLGLEVRFEPRFVEQLLIDVGLSVWPGNRPNVVVWMVRGGTESRLREPDPQLGSLVRDYSGRHGFLVRLPLLDLEDRRAIAPNDVSRLRRERLWRASSRYLADSILSGVVVGEGSAWSGRWSYLYGDQLMNFAVSAGSEAGVLRTALDTVRAALVERQSLDQSTALAVPVRLSLGGLDHFVDYAELLRYLHDLDLVRSAAVLRVDRRQLLVALDARISSVRLRELFALDRRMVEEDAGIADDGDGGADTLHYRWVRGH